MLSLMLLQCGLVVKEKIVHPEVSRFGSHMGNSILFCKLLLKMCLFQ